jgi:LEA14-like dessication related protein
MPRFASFVIAVALVVGMSACHEVGSPQLRVLGVQNSPRRDVVFVQVTNPASRPMRLTKLDYTFAADGATVSTGELTLARDVEPGAAVVVEVPLEERPTKPMTLHGELTAELDQIVRIFSVQAQIQP